MTATGQLQDEHEGIGLMLQILEKVCLRLEKKEKVDAGHLDRILEFIRVFADKCHHGKEEDLLFPALEKAGIPKDGGPIGAMLAEHGQGRTYVRGMAEAIAGIKKTAIDADGAFVKNARGYIGLLTRHIFKENNVLFPMGDKALSAREQQDLLESFARLEQERIGPGKHEEFHKLLHNLGEVYLQPE